MSEFLSMGDYAAYVWPSYIVAALSMALLLGLSVRAAKAKARELAALERAGLTRRARRQARRADPADH